MFTSKKPVIPKTDVNVIFLSSFTFNQFNVCSLKQNWNIFSFSLLEMKMALYTVIVRCYFTSIIQHFWKALSISSTYIRIYNFYFAVLCCFFSSAAASEQRKTSVVVCYPFFYLFSLLRFLFTLWKMEWKKIFLCLCVVFVLIGS